MIATIILGIIAILWLIYWKISTSKYKDIEKLPGPSSLTLLKSIFKKQDMYDTYNYIMSLNETYGPVVKLWLKPFTPKLLVTELKYIEQILLSSDHLNKTSMYAFFEPYVGSGLGTSKAEVWRKQRKLANPAFHLQTLENAINVFQKHLDILLGILEKHVGEPFDVTDVIEKYTLDVICDSLVKQETSFQMDDDATYISARTKFLTTYLKRVYTPLLHNKFIFKLTDTYIEQQKQVKIMKHFTATIIKARKEARKNNTVINGDKERLSLLDLLLDSDVEEREMGDNINTFIIAGHDTVAAQMSLTLFEIAKREDIQKKILDETTSILGNDKNALITFSDTQQMKYLECVIKESLRLQGVIPMVERVVEKDINIDGVHIPQGTEVAFCIHNIHRSEKNFSNPHTFDPDRFLQENAEQIRPNTYLPFSGGMRNCIGRHFAMLEMKCTLAKIIRNFELQPVQPEHKLKIIAEMVIKSINGIPIVFKERHM